MKPLVKVPYYPGCLLKEFSTRIRDKQPILQGLFLIISMDEFDVLAIALYDKDGYFKPNNSVCIPHKDINKVRKSYSWIIQEPINHEKDTQKEKYDSTTDAYAS